MKRILMLMIGASLALALVGCNGGTDEAATNAQGAKTPPGGAVNEGEGGQAQEPQ